MSLSLTFSCLFSSWCLCRKYWSFSCCFSCWCFSWRWRSSNSHMAASRATRQHIQTDERRQTQQTCPYSPKTRSGLTRPSPLFNWVLESVSGHQIQGEREGFLPLSSCCLWLRQSLSIVAISSLCCWMIFFRAPSRSCCCFCRNSCSCRRYKGQT